VENVNNGVASVSSPLQQKAYCSNDKHSGPCVGPIFPLGYSRVRARTGRETRAHKKLGAHIIVLSKNAFAHAYFIHVIPNSDEFR